MVIHSKKIKCTMKSIAVLLLIVISYSGQVHAQEATDANSDVVVPIQDATEKTPAATETAESTQDAATDKTTPAATKVQPVDEQALQPQIQPEVKIEEQAIEKVEEQAEMKTEEVKVLRAEPVETGSKPLMDSTALSNDTSKQVIDAKATKNVIARATDLDSKIGRSKSYGAFIALDTFLSQGTFVSDSTLRSTSATVGNSLTLVPYYGFKLLDHKISLSLRLGMDVEYTKPNNATGRRFNPSDTIITLSDRNIYKVGGFIVNGSISASVPTSYESIASRRIINPGFSLGGKYRYSGLEVAYNFGFRGYISTKSVKNVPDYYQQYLRPGEDPAAGTANRALRLSNSFSVAYSLPDIKSAPFLSGLAISVNFVVLNDFKYAVTDEDDEYTSMYAKSGMGREDWFWTTIAVEYPILSNLILNVGLGAFQPAKKSDTESFYVPLFGALFSNAADNSAQWFASLVYLY